MAAPGERGGLCPEPVTRWVSGKPEIRSVNAPLRSVPQQRSAVTPTGITLPSPAGAQFQGALWPSPQTIYRRTTVLPRNLPQEITAGTHQGYPSPQPPAPRATHLKSELFLPIKRRAGALGLGQRFPSQAAVTQRRKRGWGGPCGVYRPACQQLGVSTVLPPTPFSFLVRKGPASKARRQPLAFAGTSPLHLPSLRGRPHCPKSGQKRVPLISQNQENPITQLVPTEEDDLRRPGLRSPPGLESRGLLSPPLLGWPSPHLTALGVLYAYRMLCPRVTGAQTQGTRRTHWGQDTQDILSWQQLFPRVS